MDLKKNQLPKFGRCLIQVGEWNHIKSTYENAAYVVGTDTYIYLMKNNYLPIKEMMNNYFISPESYNFEPK